MPRLFTYTIPVDDGAAPNPFHGMCSLAICKPRIRSVAEPGDWIAGLGSKNAPSGDLSNHLIYAMRVEETLSLEEYDQLAPERWSHRIPDVNSPHLIDRLGDCSYDYSTGKAVQRRGVHGPINRDADLAGKQVLISKDFYYFGNRAIKLPDNLHAICHQTQGHRSDKNAEYFDLFTIWLRGRDFVIGQIYGWPDYIVDWDKVATCGGCTDRMPSR